MNCFQSLATGIPRGVVASDFDLDGKTDLAIIATDEFGQDSLFVLYNTGNVSGISEENFQQIPENFSLSQNYPNPFNPSTTIRFELPESDIVTLKIFNILGEEVSTLVNTELKAGKHEYQFNANNLSSGIYFYRIQAGSFTETKKMILIR
ncbi:MAG: T9SS type A sorting domain-containing protein [Ignavibacteriota bacterium]|nr:T9SS type A sorting domain-containing protein [Ignavibacterium album]QKK01020.1 MAG: T9SS type A sorting domain-containing protein [Ignavibacteriota bacterium]